MSDIKKDMTQPKILTVDGVVQRCLEQMGDFADEKKMSWCIKKALLSFAKREAEPLVQALVEIKKYSVPPFTGIKWTNLVNDIADKALTAWREKYGEGKK